MNTMKITLHQSHRFALQYLSPGEAEVLDWVCAHATDKVANRIERDAAACHAWLCSVDADGHLEIDAQSSRSGRSLTRTFDILRAERELSA